MHGFNPYAPPRAQLVDPRPQRALREAGWLVSELQVLCGLAVVQMIGILVLAVLTRLPTTAGPGFNAMLALSLLLLWGYLLLRLLRLLRDREAVQGLEPLLAALMGSGVLLMGGFALQHSLPGTLASALLIVLRLLCAGLLGGFAVQLWRRVPRAGLQWLCGLLLGAAVLLGSQLVELPVLFLLALASTTLAHFFRDVASALKATG